MIPFGLIELAVLAAHCLLTALIATQLAGRAGWRSDRIAALSPLPIPALLSGLCAIAMISAFTATKEECGVDACGMAAAGAMFGLIVAGVLYGAGFLFAWLVVSAARR